MFGWYKKARLNSDLSLQLKTLVATDHFSSEHISKVIIESPYCFGFINGYIECALHNLAKDLKKSDVSLLRAELNFIVMPTVSSEVLLMKSSQYVHTKECDDGFKKGQKIAAYSLKLLNIRHDPSFYSSAMYGRSCLGASRSSTMSEEEQAYIGMLRLWFTDSYLETLKSVAA
jgi:hypothetical protein